jgi:hypothetical protein
MRWRNGETVGVEKSMILLLWVNEADCLDHQHRRVRNATNHRRRGRSAYRASGLDIMVARHKAVARLQ